MVAQVRFGTIGRCSNCGHRRRDEYLQTACDSSGSGGNPVDGCCAGMETPVPASSPFAEHGGHESERHTTSPARIGVVGNTDLAKVAVPRARVEGAPVPIPQTDCQHCTDVYCVRRAHTDLDEACLDEQGGVPMGGIVFCVVRHKDASSVVLRKSSILEH